MTDRRDRVSPTDDRRCHDDLVGRYAITAECTRSEFLAAAKLYARAVVEEHDLTVDVSGLDWEVSAHAQRRAGAVKHVDGDPVAVVLAWKQFQERGWSETAATIRHELAHVHLLNEAGDASHGERFERLAERLDTHLHCDRFADPRWWVTCEDCGERLARYRESRLVREPDRYRCGECGGAFTVTCND